MQAEPTLLTGPVRYNDADFAVPPEFNQDAADMHMHAECHRFDD
jgi:hypothetical protein